MIVGPANCGKTFLLQPLTNIYKAFSNPATGSFAWVGVEESEIIFLNDFRWTEKVITWQDLLQLLEGDKVHIPAPKSYYSKDIVFDSDSPVFATSINKLRSYSGGVINEVETNIMKVRLKYYSFFISSNSTK
jgi:hypothetical protein